MYWGDTGSQNHTGFKCTTQQNIVCMLRRAPIIPSKSLSSPLMPLGPLPPAHPPFPLTATTQLSVSLRYMYLWIFLNPFTFLHPAPKPPPC